MDDVIVRIAKRASAEMDGGVVDEPSICISAVMIEAGQRAAVQLPSYLDTYSEERIYRIYLEMERARLATREE
ncbi:hypothetical protein [Pelagibacterium sp. H642]|uniref:hypothetical protein n=1 Tax=Pelagibacterium sp. H642 TaxID=1881069 RepID=UPI002814C3AE|nr:hypothetical protein [Pelagibacterium sp. H642]WMT90161.1 hypothetical protein NO934_15390 [Pelagibacterium sp. H642]